MISRSSTTTRTCPSISMRTSSAPACTRPIFAHTAAVVGASAATAEHARSLLHECRRGRGLPGGPALPLAWQAVISAHVSETLARDDKQASPLWCPNTPAWEKIRASRGLARAAYGRRGRRAGELRCALSFVGGLPHRGPRRRRVRGAARTARRGTDAWGADDHHGDEMTWGSGYGGAWLRAGPPVPRRC